MMSHSGLNVSSKNDVIPNWTSQEVSTGVSVQFIIRIGRIERCFVRVKYFKVFIAPE